ncbi:MAG: hypothetical protein FWF21_04855 [Micrococcales bacterium]|nr:hypothetical protein [Micrococcales bacterium]
MLTRRRQTLTLFTIAVSMNTGLFLLAHFLKLPVWLDTTGTIYIALLSGVAAGVIAGAINNILLSAVFYGFNAFWYYVISVAVAFGASWTLKSRKKRGKTTGFVFVCQLAVVVYVISVCLAIGLTLWVDGGVPSDYWGEHIYHYLRDDGLNALASTCLATATIKLLDVIATIAIVMLALRWTPKHLKSDEYLIR